MYVSVVKRNDSITSDQNIAIYRQPSEDNSAFIDDELSLYPIWH